MSEQNRPSILQRLTLAGSSLAKNAAERVQLTWQAAVIAVELRETFDGSAEQRKAFRASAATAAKVSESTIDLWTAAVDTRGTLTAKQAENVSGWNVDSVRVLAGMSTGERTKLISKAAKQGTSNVKVLRQVKNAMAGKEPAKRTTPGQAAKNAKLAERMEQDVNRLLKNGHDPVALMAGAELARKYSGDVAAGITIVATAYKAAEAAKAAKAAAKAAS